MIDMMERLTIRELSEMLDQYAMPAKRLFPLSSESLACHFSRMVNDYVSEDEIIEALGMIGYHPYISKDLIWDEDYAVPAHFKIRFVRDIHTRGLFSYDDTSLCKSVLLRRVISNSKDNDEKRMRDFCRELNTCPDMSALDVSDDDIIEYLKWMALHAPSPRSTLAALSLFYIDKDFAGCITPDQLQFIRENPNLIFK